MRRRVIAATALAAWSKTVVATAASPAVAAPSPVASTTVVAGPCVPGGSAMVALGPPELPATSPPQVRVTGFPNHYKNTTGECSPGALYLEASADRTHWKVLGNQHTTGTGYESLAVQQGCLPGAWWYQGVYMKDDGSFKAGTDAAVPTRFTC